VKGGHRHGDDDECNPPLGADRRVDTQAGSSIGSLLALLLADPGAHIHLRELARRAGVGVSSVQREVEHLERLGILRSERRGSNRFFYAEVDHPFYPELRALVLKGALVAPPARSEDVTGAEGRVNPRLRPLLPRVVDACRRHHVSRVALFGSATETDPEVEPRDADVLVTFEALPADARAGAYADLLVDLESIMGMPVDIVVSTSVRNPYLRDELDRTQVVLYEVA
jgi:predicted nucleotidyltransferase